MGAANLPDETEIDWGGKAIAWGKLFRRGAVLVLALVLVFVGFGAYVGFTSGDIDDFHGKCEWASAAVKDQAQRLYSSVAPAGGELFCASDKLIGDIPSASFDDVRRRVQTGEWRPIERVGIGSGEAHCSVLDPKARVIANGTEFQYSDRSYC